MRHKIQLATGKIITALSQAALKKFQRSLEPFILYLFTDTTFIVAILLQKLYWNIVRHFVNFFRLSHAAARAMWVQLCVLLFRSKSITRGVSGRKLWGRQLLNRLGPVGAPGSALLQKYPNIGGGYPLMPRYPPVKGNKVIGLEPRLEVRLVLKYLLTWDWSLE